MAAKELNDRHRRFADEYLIDFNGAAAYARAGYSATGNAAYASASRLLAREDVQAYLTVRRQEAKDAATVSQAAVLDRLAKLALGDIRELFDERGCMKPIQDLTPDQAALIQGVEVFEEMEGRGDDRAFVGYTRKIRFVPKLDGIKLLGQHFGMFARKVEVTGPNGKPVQHEHAGFAELLEMVEGADTGPGRSVGRRASDAP